MSDRAEGQARSARPGAIEGAADAAPRVSRLSANEAAE